MQIRLRHSARWTRDLAPADRRLWLFWAVGWRVEVRKDPVWDFVIYWKRLAVVSLVLVVGGYLGAVTALHWWWGRQPEARVRWADIALAPVRWEAFRRTRGEVSIAVGLKQLEQGNISGAAFNLRAGLSRSPHNIPARIALARLHMPRPSEAIRLLDTGLELDPDQPDLLRAVFATYELSDAATAALARAKTLLDSARRPALAPEVRRAILIAQASFLAKTARYEEALASLPEADLSDKTVDAVRAVRMRISLLSRLGRHDQARQMLEQARRQQPSEGDVDLELEIAVAAGDESAVLSAVRRMKVERPTQVQPLLAEFEAWHKLKRASRYGEAERQIYAQFGATDRAMQEFGMLLVRLELADTLQRVQVNAQARGLSPFAFEVDQTELALRQGNFAEALRGLQRWEGSLASLDAVQRQVPALIARLARACALGSPETITSLHTHLEKNPALVTPLRCRWVVERLEAAGRYAAAGPVLTLALERFPLSDSLQQQNQSVSLMLAREKPAEQTRPEEKPVEAVPTSAAQALLVLDQQIAAGKYSAASEQLQQWRQARPEWLADAERELAVRELHVELLTQDPWLARFAVRKHLEKYRRGDAAVRLVELAMALRVAGKTSEADIVSSEVAEMRGNLPAVAEALAKLNNGDSSAAAFTSAPSALALIDQALKRKDPENALWLIDRVRRTAPDWLKDVELDLAAREIKGRLAADQRARAYGALRDLVVKPGAPRAAAFRLVRDYIAEGNGDTALALAKEIERLVPGEPAVSVLVREAGAAQGGKH